MIQDVIAKRYAKALIDVASDTKSVDAFGEQLNSFLALWNDSESKLAITLTNSYLDLAGREQAIEQISQKLALAEPIKNFLKLLLRKGRISLLPNVQCAYSEYADKLMDRAVMTLVSAVALTAEQVANLQKTFTKRENKTLIVRQKLDASLLGGVRVHIGDRVYDGTVRNQLDRLKQRLTA